MVSASRRKPSQISGFTLVELLVVITIISILMGLLIPAVQAARETARRNQCSTHINNLAKAAMQEEMAKKQYPGWIQNYGQFVGGIDPTDPNGGDTIAAHAKIGTWVVALLPYLDAQPTYEIWTQDKYPITNASGYTVNAAPNMVILQCPSSSSIEGTQGRNSYVSNNGMSHIPAPGSLDFATTMSRANGVFNAKVGSTPGLPVRADDIKDGLGNTALFSENLQAQPWHQLIYQGATGSPTLDDLVSTSRFTQGMVWHFRDSGGYGGADTPDSVHQINGAGSEDLHGMQMTASNFANVARPSSAHNGGVNMGFADGASRFVAQTIDYRVYQALLTPRGKSSNVPFTEYVLPGDAL